MSTIEQYPDFSGMTFEKVWAALMENREQMKELREQIKETNRRIDEAEQKKKKMSRQFKKTNLIIGRLGSRYGQRSPVKLSVEELERITESGHQKRGIELSRRMITQQNPELR